MCLVCAGKDAAALILVFVLGKGAVCREITVQAL